MNSLLLKALPIALLIGTSVSSVCSAQASRNQNPNHTKLSMDADEESVVVTGELTKNGVKSKVVIEMHAPDMAKCWTGEIPACQVAWNGTLNGRKVGNSESGSTYTRHTFHRSAKSVYMVMRDCGPYVGACEYSWQGTYNNATQSYDGEIAFYPATYGFLRVFAKSAKMIRRR